MVTIAGSTPEMRPDLQILDAEPWNERGPVDELIDLQQQAFRADGAGNYGRFGTVLLRMSHIESSIGNHSEAAAYATDATAIFERAEQTENAIAAHTVLAREHRTLNSPDLALASLQDIIRLKINEASNHPDSATPLPYTESMPILRLIRSFTAAYRTSWLIGDDTEDDMYPVPLLPKGSRRPSQEAVSGLSAELQRLQVLREPLPGTRLDLSRFPFDAIGNDLKALRARAKRRSMLGFGRVAMAPRLS